LGSERGIDVGLLAGDGGQQRLGTLQGDQSVAVLRFQLFLIGLCRIDLCLKRRTLDLVEEITSFDFRPLDKVPFLRKPVTRATIATRFTAWMRPMNSSLCVICCGSTRTTPTAGGPAAGP